MFIWVNFPHRRLLISGSGRDGDERRTTRVAGTGTAVVAAVENMATPMRLDGSAKHVLVFN